MIKTQITITTILIYLTSFITGCNKFKDPATDYHYSAPDAANDLPVSSLDAEGVNEQLITEVTNLIIREKYKRVDGMLILRNNKLVYENYFHGYSNDIPHNIYSAGKSITSILTGIAIDKGFIADVNAPVVPLLPEYTGFNHPDARKDRITIGNLLNMSAGLNCDDWYAQTESQMQQSKDWVKFTLDLAMVSEPGTQGSYCTGCAVTLGRIIENQSHASLQSFADQYLFVPLNITLYKWHLMPDGRASGGGLFFLRPRDMAKIGLLMLNHGRWNGQQIVSEQWVAQSALNTITLPGPFDGYGSLWWKQSFDNHVDSYFADGNGGQQIFIVPSKNMVIVFTGGNKNTAQGLQNFEIINKYILPATQ